MSLLYLRKLSMVVATAGGAGLDLSEFRCVFTIRRGDTQTPNTATVRVYNLNSKTAQQVQREFTRIAIQVGYGDGPLGIVFTGTIKQVRRGRESQLDTYVDVTAADGDEAYNFSTVALSLGAGSTPAQELNSILGQIQITAAALPQAETSGQGVIQQGYAPRLSSSGRPRGTVYFGMARKALRRFAATNDCVWSIQDGKLVLIPQTSYIPGAPVLITPFTGLLGVPEQTQNGLEMSVLMNPQVKIGQLVRLDSTVNQYAYSTDLQSIATNRLLAESVTKLNADGLYYVMRADHFGDSRGDEWLTELTCLAVDATVPKGQAELSAIAPSGAIKRY